MQKDLKILCIGCGQEMEPVKQIQHSRGNVHYRITRFYCEHCDYTETIRADGTQDTKGAERQAKRDITEYYNQQQQFNDSLTPPSSVEDTDQNIILGRDI